MGPISLPLLKDDIRQYEASSRPVEHYDKEVLQTAIKYVEAQWHQFGKVKLLSWEEMSRHIVSGSSAGFGFPRCKKGEVKLGAMDVAKKHWNRLAKGKNIEEWPTLIAARPGMVDRSKIKARGVWNFPFPQIIREGRFAEAFTTMLNRQKTFLGWSVKWFDGASKMLSSLFGGSDGSTIGLDFSKFDKTPRANLIRSAFKVLWGMIDFEGCPKEEIRAIKLNWNQI